MKTNYKQYAIYLIQWELNTLILAIAIIVLASMNKIYATIIANLIGSLIYSSG